MLIVLTLIFCSGVASAQQSPTLTLTQEEKDLIVARRNDQNIKVKVAPFDYTDPREWSKLGTNTGEALVALAEKLGVAADKVLESTSGKIAVGLIAVKILGIDFDSVQKMVNHLVVNIPVGLSFMLVSLAVWARYFRQFCIARRVIKSPKDGDADSKADDVQEEFFDPKDIKVRGGRVFYLSLLPLSAGIGFAILGLWFIGFLVAAIGVIGSIWGLIFYLDTKTPREA